VICFFLVSFSYTHTAPRKHSLVLLLVQEHAPPEKERMAHRAARRKKMIEGKAG